MTNATTEPAFPCRRCGATVPAGPLAAGPTRSVATREAAPRLALDRQCAACGHRALYLLA